MQQLEWKGARPQRFEGGRRHVQMQGELTANMQPSFAYQGQYGIKTFTQKPTPQSQFKPHLRIYAEQYLRSTREIDLRGKKYIEIAQQKDRIRPERMHVQGGKQTFSEFQNKGIRTFDGTGCQISYDLQQKMQRKVRLPEYQQKRNGIGTSSLGDKAYKYPQYSHNFYQQGGLIPGSTSHPLPEAKKQQNIKGTVFTKPNWDVKVKLDQLEQERKLVNSVDDWEQTTLKQANPNWNDPDTFFERMQAKKEIKDQKKGGKK